jgi:hypothetical protein
VYGVRRLRACTTCLTSIAARRLALTKVARLAAQRSENA